MRKVTLADLTQRDIALTQLIVHRMKQEGLLFQSFNPSDIIDILVKRGEYSEVNTEREEAHAEFLADIGRQITVQ